MRHYIKSLFVIFIVIFNIQPFASTPHYAVIIDAGSSGSRAHLFQYEKSLPMIHVPVINDVFNQKTKPGLSSFVNNPAEAGASLKPVLDKAVLYLQAHHVDLSRVPVRVLATAGMRLLPLDKQAAIYVSVRHYIRDHYDFSLNDQNVRTITGTMEGVYGWLDVNYLANNFTHPSTTIGSIDMGGASTQIAFATNDTSHPDNEVTLTINHTPYRIFSQSFLGLGQDQARKTMTADPSSPSCYPEGYAYDSQVGRFDFSTCSSIYTSVIQNHDVEQTILPEEGYPFIAYAGIYYTYSFFNILKLSTQDGLQTQINATCYQSWDTLQLNYPNIPSPYLANFCANGVYYNKLLHDAYPLHEAQLTVTDTINGTEIDWTLGALLYSLGMN